MPTYQTLEEFDVAPSISENEHVRFDIHHLPGVRKLRLKQKLLSLLRHPVTLVVFTWLMMAILLAFEIAG